MKRIVAFLAATVVVFAFFLPVSAAKSMPNHTDKFFVNDFADVIDNTDEDVIYEKGVQLYEKTTAQVVVLTVETLDGESPDEYAFAVGDKWGVGQEKEDNGIVLLFAEAERQIFIAVGDGLGGALPDSKTGRIIDTYGLDDLKANRFSSGITSIYNSLVNEVYVEYNMEPEDGYTPIDENSDGVGKYAISWIILIIVLIWLIPMFIRHPGLLLFFGPRGPRGGGFGGGGFGGGGGFRGGGFGGGGGSFGGGGAGRGF